MEKYNIYMYRGVYCSEYTVCINGIITMMHATLKIKKNQGKTALQTKNKNEQKTQTKKRRKCTRRILFN
jgi:phage/plasmid primase-like uncharacterized protein